MDANKEAIERYIKNLTDEYNVVLGMITEDCSFRSQVAILRIKLDKKKLVDNFKDLLTISEKIFDLQMMLKELKNGEKSN